VAVDEWGFDVRGGVWWRRLWVEVR
jgi:hypothetical protein